jgi:pre-rRNA-processing protein TSR1
VFSQHNLNCDKHKFERFLPEGAFCAATVFGPVTYTPCPVLVFRQVDQAKEPAASSSIVAPGKGATGRRRDLIAVGSMIGADADRIVVKRIILTGYPVRVHKRYATVKYMFYNPEDVKWFKPAGLYTKHGLHGHIVDSIGDHGTMKCLFNAPIQQHDTVCLPLYKRIYPKYAPSQEEKGSSSSTYMESKTRIVVR